MRVKEYLKNEQEAMPTWLKNYCPGYKLDFNEILSHRVVYYPGSYTDGQAVRTFNKAHYTHTYVYVDYMLKKETLREELYKDEAFKGYKLIDLREVSENELLPGGWVQHYRPSQEEIDAARSHLRDEMPYCLLAILEREEGYTEEHGAERFAIIFLYADGIATYDALFINRGKAPDVLLFQDHGFGCNYDAFGTGGIMEKIAIENNILPKYIMTRDEEGHHRAWVGYKKVENVEHEYRAFGHRRYLFKKV